MSEPTKPLTLERPTPGHWRVVLHNPPINLIDNAMYDELYDLVTALEADPSVKVVTFESANPDFFLAHYGASSTKSRFGVPPWIDTARRLAACSALSIAVVRGRCRGGGCEFAMGLDLRFASRERAIFGQPEVGTGLIPGGGAMQRLPLLVGRARALEIVLGADDFSAELAERYGWVNRAVADAELDEFVQRFVRRICSFDAQALATAKATINAAGGLPDQAQLESTQSTFFTTYEWAGFKKRAPILRERGLGQPGSFELDLGRHVGELDAE